MSEYARNKLLVKLTKFLGKNASNDILNKLMLDFNGYGKYKIIWNKGEEIIPISLIKIDDEVVVQFIENKYVSLNDEIVYICEYIEFNIEEDRDSKLVNILKKKK